VDQTKVLFLCTGNSARSQMAEAFLRTYADDQFEVHSAGLEPRGINPYTIRVMDEVGIDLSGHRSKDVMEYLGRVHFGYVITVCDNAEENCPIFPFVTTRLHWSFEDPARFEGPDAAKLRKFREVRDRISERIKTWLAEQGIPVDRAGRPAVS
jgi:arsenate reductase